MMIALILKYIRHFQVQSELSLIVMMYTFYLLRVVMKIVTKMAYVPSVVVLVEMASMESVVNLKIAWILSASLISILLILKLVIIVAKMEIV